MTDANQNNHLSYIEIPARDNDNLRQTKDFYHSVFAWHYQDWGNNYSDTKDSGISSGINADAANRPQYPLAIIYSTNLEATRAKVIAGNGKITRDIFTFPGGRRFHFQDPAGNELGVWSDK